jgi:hypothetical protein
VDTSAAQFGGTPAYFTHVMGPRTVFLGTGDVGISVYLLTVAMVSNPAPDGFNCDVILLVNNPIVNAVTALDPALYGLVIAVIQWTVVWMGVEG